MANEYLETELGGVAGKAASAAGCVPSEQRLCRQLATPAADRPPRSQPSAQSLEQPIMADVTYYVALPFLEDDDRLACRGRRRGMPELDGTALRRAEACCRESRRRHRRGCLQPDRRSHDRRIRRTRTLLAEIRQRAGRSERVVRISMADAQSCAPNPLPAQTSCRRCALRRYIAPSASSSALPASACGPRIARRRQEAPAVTCWPAGNTKGETIDGVLQRCRLGLGIRSRWRSPQQQRGTRRRRAGRSTSDGAHLPAAAPPRSP